VVALLDHGRRNTLSGSLASISAALAAAAPLCTAASVRVGRSGAAPRRTTMAAARHLLHRFAAETR